MGLPDQDDQISNVPILERSDAGIVHCLYVEVVQSGEFAHLLPSSAVHTEPPDAEPAHQSCTEE
jgi:hypothetical protein